MARHVQSTHNRNLAIFWQYIKKNVSQLLHLQIFYDSPVMFVVTCFLVVVVKNGSSLSDYGTLKSAIYISRMNWWNELIFLYADSNLGKLNVNLIIIRWICSKYGWDILDHGTLKSGISHKWLDQSSRLMNFACWERLNNLWPPISSLSLTFAGCLLQLRLLKMMFASQCP